MTKHKIAWISPLAPTKSGIAAYSTELLNELAEHYEIDVFVDDETHELPSAGSIINGLPHNINIYSKYTFWHYLQNANYHKIIFQHGSSVYHQYNLSLLLQAMAARYDHEQILHILHDVPLGVILFQSLVKSDDITAWLLLLTAYEKQSATIEFMNAWQAYKRVPEKGAGEDLQLAIARVGMRLLGLTGQLITHKRMTSDDLYEGYGLESTSIVQSRTIPNHLTYEDSRLALGVAPHHKIVATFGHVQANKNVIEFIQAAQQALDECNLAGEIWIVGPHAQQDYVLQIRELASLDDRIKLFSYVDDDQWHLRMKASDCIVQLRDNALGAVSSPAVQAIRHRRPTVLNSEIWETYHTSAHKAVYSHDHTVQQIKQCLTAPDTIIADMAQAADDLVYGKMVDTYIKLID